MNLLKSIAIVFLVLVTPASAQPPMLEETDAAELIGGAVQSAEGIEVGEVSAVTMNKDGEVTEIRMNMEQSLGIGERTVILPRGRYVVLRGTVVLQLPLENIRQLPATEDRARP
jgi:ribosomal 30S subunit maturation factor RimM